jgi:GGDEF domain-containing protein
MKRLEIAQADIKRHGVEGSLMFIDLLNFKGINDL